jgi:membrane protease YdiL (CAAX protease family)
MKPTTSLSTTHTFIYYLAFTVYFYFLLFTVHRIAELRLTQHPALAWFITAYALFIPLFVIAILSVRQEGARKLTSVLHRLNIRQFTTYEWKLATIGLLASFIGTGIVFGTFSVLYKWFGLNPLSTTPWFIKIRPFAYGERWMLLIWLPMFFFNIIGEEILWRGYLQARMRSHWMWSSAFWLMFHAPFGFDMMLMLTPIMLIVPYLFNKTHNTLIGIFIHGIYNGPVFVAIVLGIIAAH